MEQELIGLECWILLRAGHLIVLVEGQGEEDKAEIAVPFASICTLREENSF
jgi:hypothetical protein